MVRFEANKWVILACYCMANGAATIDGTAFASYVSYRKGICKPC